MICPTCLFKHASPGIPCGSCGGTLHGSIVIAESRTPVVELPEIPQQLGAAIVGFAGPAVEVQPQSEVVAPVVEEVVAPAVEVAAPVQEVDPLQQSEAKRTPKKRTTVN